MGIIGWIGLGFEIVKLILAIISLLRQLRKDSSLPVKQIISMINSGIAEYKMSGSSSRLHEIKDMLDKLASKKEGIGQPPHILRDF